MQRAHKISEELTAYLDGLSDGMAALWKAVTRQFPDIGMPGSDGRRDG